MVSVVSVDIVVVGNKVGRSLDRSVDFQLFARGQTISIK